MTKETPNTVLPTKYITPEITCSFPYLFEVSDYTGKFGLAIPIPKEAKAELKKIKTLIGNAAENKWGKTSRNEIGKKIVSPLRDGDEEKGDDEVYQGTTFFSANASLKPGVVDQASGLKPILEQEEIYPGCIVRASLNFFAYDFKGKKGVACGLQNVMKVRDGEQIGGKASAESDFSDFSDENSDENSDEEEVEEVF